MNNVYSVGQVNRYVKNMFTQDYFLQNIYVKGEVSNCKYHSTGHIYFTLKDEGGTLKCVMFAGSRRGLAFRMKDGDKVIAGGRVDVYERDGAYQFYAKEITLEGAGALYERYLALKQELEDMGMFDCHISYRCCDPGYYQRFHPKKSFYPEYSLPGTCAGRGSSGQYCTWYPHAGRGRRGCDHCRTGRWFYRGTMGF